MTMLLMAWKNVQYNVVSTYTISYVTIIYPWKSDLEITI